MKKLSSIILANLALSGPKTLFKLKNAIKIKLEILGISIHNSSSVEKKKKKSSHAICDSTKTCIPLVVWKKL